MKTARFFLLAWSFALSAFGAAPVNLSVETNGVLRAPTEFFTANQSAITALSSGVYQPLDSDLTALAGIAGVSGDIIYHNGSTWVSLAKGTNGQSLQLSAGFPTWATVVAGGGGVGDVTLAGTNAFTGPNSFAGVTTFNGAANLNGSTTISNLTVPGTLAVGSITSDTPLGMAIGGTGGTNATTARSSLGVAYDVDVQAYRLGLLQAALALTADGHMLWHNGTLVTNLASTAAGRALLTAASASAQWNSYLLSVATTNGTYDATSWNGITDRTVTLDQFRDVIAALPAALALLTAANVFTSTNTFQGPSIFATLIITNLDLLNPLPNRGVSNSTPSRGAIWGADNRLTNDVADTGTGAPVRAVSPALTGSPSVPTASVGSSNTLAASTEYVDRAVGAGGGGGGGTSVTVNGSTVTAKFTNNAAATGGIILVTNANGEILMVATNFPAGGGDASVGVNNVFTGVNRFTNGTPQSFSRPPRVLGGRIASWTAPQMTPGTNSSIQAQYRVLGDGVSSMEFDGTTSEEISMLGVLGQDPDTGSTVTLTFASDDTANTVCWQAQWQLLTLRGIDTNLLSTAATWTSNIPGTARVPTNITIALNPPTGVVGGTNDFSKPFMLRITRLPGSDSSLSNAYLIAVDHRYAQ